ncbi:hypothetical protein BOX15_Mlig023179g2 [Macrostomum lignano]|uniref:Cilia- and flagella-associated protein 300 n=1 Tax=Macrostomum lignano TaxID=282301 RepID=A0A267E9R5_9PLAT|nr:hypothetical protein BOX15_Mlig023179g2 [Macrostomum lignano]
MQDVKINSSNDSQQRNFQYLAGKATCLTQNKEFKDYLMKWSMKGRIFCQCFSFDCQFKVHSAQEFIEDFFKDNVIVSNLQTVSDNTGEPVAQCEKASSVSLEPVPCTHTTMDLFGRLADEVIRDDGQIKRCFDEWIDEVQISDNLRQMLLNEDSEAYLLYDEPERNEFLFRLLLHFAIGGRLCQFEDSIHPYLDIVKALYKDLITVQKDPETRKLQVISHVYKVVAKDDKGRAFYPDSGQQQHLNTFAYLIIDPLKRLAFVLHHRFGNGQF